MKPGVDFLAQGRFEEATVWVLTGNRMGRTFYQKHGWTLDGGAKSAVWDGVAMDEVRFRLPMSAPR